MPEVSDTRFSKLEEKIDKMWEKMRKFDDLIYNQQRLHESCKAIKEDIVLFKEKFDKMEQLIKDWEGTKKSLSFLNEKYEKNKDLLISVQNECKEQRKDIHALQADNLVFKNQVNHLLGDSDRLFTDLHDKELELAGVPVKQAENISSIVQEIAKKASVSVSQSDIISAVRLVGGRGKTGNIKLVLSSVDKRNLFMESVKKSKITANGVGFEGQHTKIYANEVLSPRIKNLLYNTKLIQRECNWKFAWVKSGCVYIRKSEGENAIRINTLEELILLKS